MISRTIKVIDTAIVLPPMYSTLYSGDPIGHLENDLVDVDAISLKQMKDRYVPMGVSVAKSTVYLDCGERKEVTEGVGIYQSR